MVQKVFNRYEKKYLLDAATYAAFKAELDAYMTEDKYGVHNIRNIYFDTEDSELIRTSIEKPPYKEKFRIRCYGQPTPDSECFLEIKKKYRGLVNKRRIVLHMDEAEAYLGQGRLPSYQGQIFQEIEYFFRRYSLAPRRYISYDRLALYGNEDPDFRVTFDQNIRSRTTNLTLYNAEATELLLEPGYSLMEVKVGTAMPLWFAQLLSKYGLYNQSFSKYGSFYMRQCCN